MKFEVLSHWSLKEFNKMVQGRLDEGWKLHGETTVLVTKPASNLPVMDPNYSEAEVKYSQAVTLDERFRRSML